MSRRQIILPITLAAAVMPAAAADARSGLTLRYFDKPTDITLVHADGSTEPNPKSEPVAGDVLEIYSVDYRGTRKHHRATISGSAYTVCTFRRSGPPTCESHVEVAGGLLVVKDDEVVGGTRRFRGATGTVKNTGVSDRDNSANATLRLRLRR